MENDEVILIERGVSVIVFNFAKIEHQVEISNCDKMELIFTHNADDT